MTLPRSVGNRLNPLETLRRVRCELVRVRLRTPIREESPWQRVFPSTLRSDG
ncbi:hypothetical protein EKPJFOCH_3002 [Methylobacterium thuringiense]|uniref:Uncharacterized protein n=1 Tax=Methylobacterium thuringiense TaxID=1003091 RepID=A0ABQ4TPC8_9HYPH|nr:hypothetical protein EKPJFOCH_3002 [Methylobacterium thuringiense]